MFGNNYFGGKIWWQVFKLVNSPFFKKKKMKVYFSHEKRINCLTEPLLCFGSFQVFNSDGNGLSFNEIETFLLKNRTYFDVEVFHF